MVHGGHQRDPEVLERGVADVAHFWGGPFKALTGVRIPELGSVKLSSLWFLWEGREGTL